MATSLTSIANTSLIHLGATVQISNVLSDQTKEAKAFRQVYEVVRDAVFAEHEWEFCKSYIDLALIEEDPTDEWRFMYGYPAHCAKVRRILSGARPDNRTTLVPFEQAIALVDDVETKVLYSNRPEATVEYTRIITNVALWPPSFVAAFGYRWAADISPVLTGGEMSKKGLEALAKYRLQLELAKATDANEGVEMPDGPGPGAMAREGLTNWPY